MTSTKITAIWPIGSRLVVYPIEQNLLLQSGIMLPEQSRDDRPTEGVVAATGYLRDENGDKIEMDIEQGDRVLFTKYGGIEVEVDGSKFLILRYDDILAVVTSDEEPVKSES